MLRFLMRRSFWVGYRLVIFFQRRLRRLEADPWRVEYASPKVPGKKRIWFHAASVGELESLWGAIEQLSTHTDCEMILTVYSRSALRALGRLGMAVRDQKNRPLWLALSPNEGDWSAALTKWEPDIFITVRYEAWPELWQALASRAVPLVLLNAQYRTSLKVMRWLLRMGCVDAPRGVFLGPSVMALQELQVHFPAMQSARLPDPRWDRVRHRLTQKNERLQELLELTKTVRSSFAVTGVLGSAWPSDLVQIGSALRPGASAMKEWLWVVPHEVQGAAFTALEGELQRLGRRMVRSSQLKKTQIGALVFPQAWDGVLVDELGFLAELYGHATWAYVGGGFEKGIHSVLEPAVSRLPVLVGPKRFASFLEAGLLQENGLLRKLEKPAVPAADWDWLRAAGMSWKTHGYPQAAWLQEQFGGTEQLVSLALRFSWEKP